MIMVTILYYFAKYFPYSTKHDTNLNVSRQKKREYKEKEAHEPKLQ